MNFMLLELKFKMNITRMRELNLKLIKFNLRLYVSRIQFKIKAHWILAEFYLHLNILT